jgi:hypothetical protein
MSVSGDGTASPAASERSISPARSIVPTAAPTTDVQADPAATTSMARSLEALAATTDSATRGGKITRAYNEAVEEKKRIKKLAKDNSAKLKNVRQQRYRLLARMDGLDEDNMDNMQELFREVRARKAAKKAAQQSSASSPSRPFVNVVMKK